MTNKQRRLIKARLAEVRRKWEKPALNDQYTVYRHGRPAYQRQLAQESWLIDGVLAFTMVALGLFLLLSV